MGATAVVLTRAARAGDAPAVASRWLQRLLTFAGREQAPAMRARGDDAASHWARGLDAGEAGAVRATARTRSRRSTRGRRTSRSPRSRRCGATPMPSMRAACWGCRRSTRCCATPARPSAARCSTTSCTASPQSCPDPRDAGRRRALIAAGATCFRRGRAAGRRRCRLVAALRARSADEHPRLGARPSAPWRQAPPRRGRAPSHCRSATPASRCPAMPTASTCCRPAWPTSSTTRPAPRPRRRRRTRCLRRSWRWKARC